MFKLRGYQVQGVEQTLEWFVRQHGVLIADDMGLGKTAQAIEICRRGRVNRVLVVCPLNVKLQWISEFNKWYPEHKYLTNIMEGRDATPAPHVLKPCLDIINYALLPYVGFSHTEYDLIVYDEAHYLKNPEAQRTGGGARIKAYKRLLLTGTPIMNRPKEVWQLLLLCGVVSPEQFHSFGLRFCGAWQEEQFRSRGKKQNRKVVRELTWNYDGSSNLEELNHYLRSTCMIRRMKREVMSELPQKTRQIIELPTGGYAATNAVESQIRQRVTALKRDLDGFRALSQHQYSDEVKRLDDEIQVALEEMSLVRHELALAKIPDCVEFIRNALLSGRKICVFAHHRDMIDALSTELDDPNDQTTIVIGGMSAERKKQVVDQFIENPDKRVLIGQMQAIGTGTDGLQKSCAHAIFVELPWSPAELSQCEDRLCRIGQDLPVLVQHLVVDGSLDARIAKTLVRKQKILDKVDQPIDINWIAELGE